MNAKTIALALFWIAGTALAADKPEPQRYEPAVTTIQGIVKNDKAFYGPPGFGKTPDQDEKELVIRLVLDGPISIVPSKGDDTNAAVDNVTELQIVPNEVPDLSPFIDRRVTITGKMFQAHTAYHHTPALIAIDRIEVVRKK